MFWLVFTFSLSSLSFVNFSGLFLARFGSNCWSVLRVWRQTRPPTGAHSQAFLFLFLLELGLVGLAIIITTLRNMFCWLWTPFTRPHRHRNRLRLAESAVYVGMWESYMIRTGNSTYMANAMTVALGKINSQRPMDRNWTHHPREVHPWIRGACYQIQWRLARILAHSRGTVSTRCRRGEF